MSSLRIAYVINDAAFFVSHRLPLALEVLKLGGEVCLITGKNINKDFENYSIKILNEFNIDHYICDYSQSFKNPIKEILGLFQLIIYLKQFNPSTVHSATAKGNLMALLASNFIKETKLVLSISGFGTLFIGKKSFRKTIFNYLYKSIFKSLIKKLDYSIIFQNIEDYNNFKNLINFNNKKAKIINGSGVDTSKLKPKKYKKYKKNILLPARMLYEKGIEEYIEASRILKEKNIEGNFYLAGDTISLNPSAISLKQIEEWSRQGLIIYKGHKYDLNELYEDMDIICLPSWREGFPKVLMEAASYGLPVITTDVPGCRDAVINNKTALLVPVKNKFKLAEAIVKLLENTKLRIKMGKANRNLALSKFDLKYIIPKVIKLYK